MHSSADVVVVGAGLAGLTAARDLARAGQHVIVLEARDRVGGRTTGHRLSNGVTVEMGGAYVGPYQTAVLNLVQELGLQTFLTYDVGDGLARAGGSLNRFDSHDEALGLPEASLPDIGRVQADLTMLAEAIPQAAPWLADSAVALDQQTFDDWLTSRTQDDVTIGFYRSMIAALWCREAHEVSVLHVAFYLASAGHFSNMLSTTGGNQESRIVGGSQLISERIAEELGEDVVRHEAPVRSITQHADGVTIRFDGGTVTAGRVIVALPPSLAGEITYDPPLPRARVELTGHMPMGSVIKAQIVYTSPFWRDEGLSGFFADFSRSEGAITFTLDSSPPDATCGVLTAFVTGDRANDMGRLPSEERRELIVGQLVDVYGASAGNVVEYVDLNWVAELYTGGCYGGHPGVGVWTRFGRALAEPVGRIHWAGTETSDVSNGYMDGAVRSGHRAAGDVLAELSIAVAAG